MIFLEACLYLVVVLTGLVVLLALSWAAVHLSAATVGTVRHATRERRPGQ